MIQRLINILMMLCFSFISFSQADSIKMLKKKERIEKRYIHPKSKYIVISSGWNFNVTHTNDPNNFFDPLTMVNVGIFPNVVYEQGIKNNFFAELGYDITKQGVGLSRDMGDDRSWSRFNKFFFRHHSHNFHLGGGYRLIGKNNFHYLNFHGGFYCSISNKSDSDMNQYIGNTATYSRYEEHTNLSYQYERTLDSYSRLSVGAYLGVSTEIRLSESVRFFVKYTQRFGFNSTFSGTYVMSSNDINFDYDATFNVRGGGAFLSGGLKILLFKKKLNNNEE